MIQKQSISGKTLSGKTFDQFKELQSALEWIKSWRFRSKENPEKAKQTLPFKVGLLITKPKQKTKKS